MSRRRLALVRTVQRKKDQIVVRPQRALRVMARLTRDNAVHHCEDEALCLTNVCRKKMKIRLTSPIIPDLVTHGSRAYPGASGTSSARSA